MIRFLSAHFRAEAAANLRLALPLLLAQLSFVSMGTVDTLVAGRLGARQLAAVAVGANIWFLLFVLFMGLFMAVSPIVAQRAGAGRPAAETGGFVRGACVLALLLGLVWMVLLLALTDPVLDLLDLEPVTRGYAEAYLRAIAPGALPFTLFFALRNAAEGWGRARPTLVAGLVGFVVNAVLAYGLANGAWGLPALGPAGCGVATASASASMVLCFAALYRTLPSLQPLQLFRAGWPRIEAQTFEILRVGGPIALILSAEAWLFLIGALLMARFGPAAVGAHQIAINFASLVFMAPLSIGMATTVRVGYCAGAGDAEGVRERGQTGIGLGAAFALLSASFMALLPGPIIAVYTQAPDVAALAVHFLYLAALFQIFDCVQATSNGALRGIKDTRVPMLVTVAAYWLVGMPLSLGLAFGLGFGPVGIWLGFLGGLGTAAAGLSWRFFHKTRPIAPRPGLAV